MNHVQNIAQQTLAGIALSHHEYIPVLEKYSLDFCCRGKKTLEEACGEKGLPVNTVAEEMSHPAIAIHKFDRYARVQKNQHDLTNKNRFHTKQVPQFPDPGSNMANTHSTVMCRAMAVPLVYKLSCANAEPVAAVGIADL